MSSADLYIDGFPHGTPAGYAQGCRGSACPEKLDGHQSCAEAKTRYAGDYGYRRRVDAGLSPAEIRDAEKPAAAPAPAPKPAPAPAPKASLTPAADHVTYGELRTFPKGARRNAEVRRLLALGATVAIAVERSGAPEAIVKRIVAENKRAAQATPAPAPKPSPRTERREQLDRAAALRAQNVEAARTADTPETPGSLIPAELHGTRKGYWRGCQDADRCPAGAGESCTDAQSAYELDRRRAETPTADSAPEPTVEVEPTAQPEPTPAPVLPITLPKHGVSVAGAAVLIRVTPTKDGGLEVLLKIGGTR